MARLVVAWAVNGLGLWIANALFGGLRIHGFAAYAIGAAALGIANTILRPILTILTLPLVILTLGFFLLVINIAMIALAAAVAPNFSIHGFWTYVGTIVVMWLVNVTADGVFDRSRPGRARPARS